MTVIRVVLMPFRWLAGLVTRAIHWVEDMWMCYGQFVALGVLLVIFIVICFFRNIIILVDAGEAGVRFWRFYGMEIDHVYGEGVHVIPPWDRMEIYNVRVQETEHTATLLTVDGLEAKFALSIRYRPEYEMLGLLHQRIGHDYLNKIVIPEIDEVLRIHVGRFTAEEVYTTQRAILERIFTDAIAHVERSYVVVDRVVIRSIELPPTIRRAIEAKIEQKQAAEAYEFVLLKEQREAKRKEIEAQGYRAYNQIVSESITENVLRWRGIEATRDLSLSKNSKMIVIGNGDKNLPIILGAGQP